MKNNIDLLVAEIGSTTTIVNALSFYPPYFLARGMHVTTVDTDVTTGLREAIEDVKRQLHTDTLPQVPMYASSSAAGGLKITAHGLVYNMTAKAAKEASQSAGANVKLITANLLTDEDLAEIARIRPNMIVIAGGTDYGEKNVSYENLLKVLPLEIPIIYAGNKQNLTRIQALNHPLVTCVENVYPRVDDMNIMPLRQAIYATFETHIVKAKGMEHIKDIVEHAIIPTPGSVMDATLLASQFLKHVVTLDVGGATTDVHSVTEPSQEFSLYMEGNAKIARTVEGDLGVYVSRYETLKHMRLASLLHALQCDEATLSHTLENEPFIPVSPLGKALRDQLTYTCVKVALDRHMGDLKRVFTSNGIKMLPEGRDLTEVNAIILTGGALLHAQDAKERVRTYLKDVTDKLAPRHDVKIYYDTLYLMSSIGVIAKDYPELAKALLHVSLKEER